MSILSGTKLGSYQITGAIGAGGMGEVYQAHDSKLGRDVAIKVLPEAFAHDPERLSRFQREAKMLAALNHPNIATIHGLEQSNGTSYLVMELVPGETLAEKIKRDGAFSVVETIAVAKQMAEALEAAHEKGIVHRDLKPANVKVTPEGKVKVLDFGLAKALADDGASQDLANSPTMTAAATMQGEILGTAAYMSPEQARGKAIDRRADIWAFGVVLYEMLTGERLFVGETVSDTLAAVLRHEPEYSRIPTRMKRLLRWCLEKDPRKRLRDITDGMALLEEGPGQEVAPTNATILSYWPWAITAAACVIALGFAFMHFREKSPTANELYRFTIRLPENVTFTPSATLTMSPDGRRVAFPAVGSDGQPSVWVQDMEGEEARPLANAMTVADPPPFFWSPDSRNVAYESNGKVQKVDIQDGTTQDICDRVVNVIGGAWNHDGVIILGSSTTGLWRVSADGGMPTPLTVLDSSRHETEHELPSFLPDGRHFIYFASSTSPENIGEYVGSLDDLPEHQSKKLVLVTRFGAIYVPSDGSTGHLLFLRGSELMAQGFDAMKFKLLGQPATVAERVGSAFETGHFSATPDLMVYRGQRPPPEWQLTWFDRQGKVAGKVGDSAFIMGPHISNDGTRVAFIKGEQNGANNGDIWLLDFKRDTTMRLTFGSSSNMFPAWSPDGREIVFSSNRDGIYNLYRKSVDGVGAEKLLLRTNEDKRALSWSRDGRYFLYDASKNAGPAQLWVLPMQGDPTPIPFSHSQFDETMGKFSPDGRWIVYMSDETGKYEIYVREFKGLTGSTDTGGKWMVSKDGGLFSLWRADGKEIVYVSPDRTSVMSVSVDTSSSFHSGSPQLLMKIPSDRGYSGIVGASPDFSRFLMPVAVEVKVPQSFTVMLNWAAGLKN